MELKDGMKSKGAESKPDKADGKATTEMKADKSKDSVKDGAKDGLKANSKGATDTKAGMTTGQAPAGAKQLNTEQRTSYPHRDQRAERQAGHECQLRDRGRNAGPAHGNFSSRSAAARDDLSRLAGIRVLPRRRSDHRRQSADNADRCSSRDIASSLRHNVEMKGRLSNSALRFFSRRIRLRRNYLTMRQANSTAAAPAAAAISDVIRPPPSASRTAM